MPLSRRRADLSVCALLVLAIGAVYAQSTDFGFIASDDAAYVSANPVVQNGLSGEGWVWAFTTSHGSNWFPLTWLSLMLDAELFGVEPGAFHRTNVILHALGTLLLFAALRALTGRTAPSALVAALHAIHPIHVESVAWIPSRKDVLAFAFGAAALWAWAGYARRGGAARYGVVAACFACGLASKPILVTLPVLLLLLDAWPLGRLARTRPATLVLEKVPLLALSLASSAVTLAVQQPAMLPVERVGAGLRLANAVVGVARYLGKLVWPESLSIFYTHPNLPGGTPWSAWEVTGAAGLLLAISLLAFAAARRHAFLPVGWLWFLVALLPMSGAVQVGGQAISDRYSYWPFVGLYIALAWLADAGLRQLRVRRAAWAAVAAALVLVALAALGVRAWLQVGVWRDTGTLMENAYRVSPTSPFVLTGLGLGHLEAGRDAEAAGWFEKALAVAPDYNEARINLGVVLARQGRIDAAIEQVRQAVLYRPWDAPAHRDLGRLLHAQGRLAEAELAYRQALALDASLGDAHRLLALALDARGEDEEAKGHFTEAIRLQAEKARLASRSAGAWAKLAELLLEARRWDRSLAAADHALGLDAEEPLALEVKAQALLGHSDPAQRDPQRAAELARRASQRRGGGAPATWLTLARAEAAAGRLEAAIRAADAARRLAEDQGLRALAERSEALRRRLEAERP